MRPTSFAVSKTIWKNYSFSESCDENVSEFRQYFQKWKPRWRFADLLDIFAKIDFKIPWNFRNRLNCSLFTSFFHFSPQWGRRRSRGGSAQPRAPPARRGTALGRAARAWPWPVFVRRLSPPNCLATLWQTLEDSFSAVSDKKGSLFLCIEKSKQASTQASTQEHNYKMYVRSFSGGKLHCRI